MNILRYEPFFDRVLFSYQGELYLTDEKIEPSLQTNLVINKDNPLNGLSAPTRLQIQFTNRCNLACSHCYVSSGKTLPNELSDEAIFDLLAQASKLGILQIEWSGGEPFSRKGLMEMVKIARKYGFEQKLLTNGVAIGRGICEPRKLWKEFCEIQISINSIGDGFNAFVGKNHWLDVSRAVDLLLKFKPKHKKLLLTTTIDRSNIAFLPVIYEYMSGKDVNWRIARQVHNGRSSITEEESDKLLFDSWTILQGLRNQKSKAKILHPFDKITDLNSVWPLEWQTEPGARWFMYINALGNGYPFPYFDGIAELYGGNVLKNSLAQIWKSEAFNYYRSITRRGTKCRNCQLVCQMWSRPFNYFRQRNLSEDPIEHPNCPLLVKQIERR
ncbi:MAG: radical SAM protein [Patescibacteria group bacterium]